MPSIITIDYAEDLPVLGGLTPEQRRSVLDNADKVYKRVRNRETNARAQTTENDIRGWGLGLTPPINATEMTAALAYLTETGQILWIADSSAPLGEAQAPPEPVQVLPQGPDVTPAEPTPLRTEPLENMSREKLLLRAKELNIQGRTTLTERQLRNRIRKAETGTETRDS